MLNQDVELSFLNPTSGGWKGLLTFWRVSYTQQARAGLNILWSQPTGPYIWLVLPLASRFQYEYLKKNRLFVRFVAATHVFFNLCHFILGELGNIHPSHPQSWKPGVPGNKRQLWELSGRANGDSKHRNKYRRALKRAVLHCVSSKEKRRRRHVLSLHSRFVCLQSGLPGCVGLVT